MDDGRDPGDETQEDAVTFHGEPRTMIHVSEIPSVFPPMPRPVPLACHTEDLYRALYDYGVAVGDLCLPGNGRYMNLAQASERLALVLTTAPREGE